MQRLGLSSGWVRIRLWLGSWLCESFHGRPDQVAQIDSSPMHTECPQQWLPCYGGPQLRAATRCPGCWEPCLNCRRVVTPGRPVALVARIHLTRSSMPRLRLCKECASYRTQLHALVCDWFVADGGNVEDEPKSHGDAGSHWEASVVLLSEQLEWRVLRTWNTQGWPGLLLAPKHWRRRPKCGGLPHLTTSQIRC